MCILRGLQGGSRTQLQVAMLSLRLRPHRVDGLRRTPPEQRPAKAGLRQSSSEYSQKGSPRLMRPRCLHRVFRWRPAKRLPTAPWPVTRSLPSRTPALACTSGLGKVDHAFTVRRLEPPSTTSPSPRCRPGAAMPSGNRMHLPMFPAVPRLRPGDESIRRVLVYKLLRVQVAPPRRLLCTLGTRPPRQGTSARPVLGGTPADSLTHSAPWPHRQRGGARGEGRQL